LGSSYQEGRVGNPVIKRGGLEIQLSRGECWDPVIKRGVLGSSYQEGSVGIQLSRGGLEIQSLRGEGWRSSYQEGRVGIQLSRGECWELNGLTPPHCVCLTVTRTWISNVKVRDDIVLLVLVELLTITV
jgi:hypothetical protein